MTVTELIAKLSAMPGDRSVLAIETERFGTAFTPVSVYDDNDETDDTPFVVITLQHTP